ncbi:hypothetical protein, partial [Klebsiella pneumoniae]|uniref:hypothetical protein n=1 Tax=Klebsiella pneumoniae TaxID=573 RepID=UPI0022B631E6
QMKKQYSIILTIVALISIIGLYFGNFKGIHHNSNSFTNSVGTLPVKENKAGQTNSNSKVFNTPNGQTKTYYSNIKTEKTIGKMVDGNSSEL